MGLPAASSQAPPVAGPSAVAPLVPPTDPAVGSSGPPPIVLEDSDSDTGVQTLAVPFRSGTSEAYLPMLSTDDAWSSDTEFRFVFMIVSGFLCFLNLSKVSTPLTFI